MTKFFKRIKHIIEYIVFVIMLRSLKLLGVDISSALCGWVARIIGPLLPVSQVAIKNLRNTNLVVAHKTRQPGRLCMSRIASILHRKSRNDKCELTHDEFIVNLWDNFGRFIGEFPYIFNMSDAEIASKVTIEGLEHLEHFQKHNIPFILFTGHFANWEFALRITNKLYRKFAIIYRKLNNPYIDKLLNNYRARDDLILVAKGSQGAKDLVKAIKGGYSIAMLVDQKMNDGIEVPLFGIPAMTAHAIAKLALQFCYPIVPCQIVRTKNSNFNVIIHQELKIIKTQDINTDIYNIMLNINQILESWIIQNPTQWLWFHNRWKI